MGSKLFGIQFSIRVFFKYWLYKDGVRRVRVTIIFNYRAQMPVNLASLPWPAEHARPPS